MAAPCCRDLAPARGGAGASAGLRGLQRAQILLAAAEIARELGCRGVTVAEVMARAGVSRRAFYEIFDSRDDCLLTALEDGVQRAAARVVPAYMRQSSWRSAVGDGLAELLLFLDEEPDLAALMIVHAPGAGEQAVRLRNEIVASLVDVIDRGRAVSASPESLSRVTAEGAVGAVMSIVHTRLLNREAGTLSDQLGSLMSLIVLPYLGSRAAAEELHRPPVSRAEGRHEGEAARRRAGDRRFAGVKVRLTHRTAAVLRAVAARPGASNKEIADYAGVSDQGQISKMLARLREAGLVENQASELHGSRSNAWRLSPEGVRIERAIRGRIG